MIILDYLRNKKIIFIRNTINVRDHINKFKEKNIKSC